MAIAGRVAIVPKGGYVNGTQYKRLDLVTYNGDGYVAKLDNINVVPEDGDTWMLAWHGAAADVTERISNLESLILPANTALNKNFETDASAYKENGIASVGTSENISRSDHVHPTDQTRLSKNGDSQNNTVTFTSNDTSTSDAWEDVTVLASKEKHSSLFGKISTMFKNVRYIYTHFIKSENILDTLEEISANTQSGKVAGALSVKELNSSLLDIGKTCCFRQSNQSKVSNGYCPVDVQEYNDDNSLYKADSSGVLITKPGTYLVVAHFHINFNENDGVKLSIKNSIKELLVSNHYDYNVNNSKQLQVTLSTIVRFTTGQERVLLNIESTNGTSYIYDWTLTNINRIAITKIK